MTSPDIYSEETKIPFGSLSIDPVIMYFSSFLFTVRGERDYRELPFKVSSEDHLHQNHPRELSRLNTLGPTLILTEPETFMVVLVVLVLEGLDSEFIFVLEIYLLTNLLKMTIINHYMLTYIAHEK